MPSTPELAGAIVLAVGCWLSVLALPVLIQFLSVTRLKGLLLLAPVVITAVSSQAPGKRD